MILLRRPPPPTQVLHGAGFTLPTEVAARLARYRIRRRVQRVTVGGVVRPRVIVVTYEVDAAGYVHRLEEDGRRLPIEPGRIGREWEWVLRVLRYRRARKHGGTAPRPEDLVSLREERAGGDWIDIFNAEERT